MSISNLARVHPDAKIGNNVVIEPFAFVDRDVEIGDETWIGPNSVIFSGARIGKRCKIFPGAVISAIPQDLKFRGEETVVIIGDGTIVRESATVNRGTVALGKTIIGNNCLLMAYTHVAHDCVLGNNIVLANSVNLGGHVEIGDYAVIGGLAAVHQFNKIGDHSMVGAGIVIRKDIPPYITVWGEVNSYRGLNSIGLRRRGFSMEKIREIQDIYRIIFQENRSIDDALEVIEREIPNTEERRKIIKFIKESTRGIIRGITEE